MIGGEIGEPTVGEGSHDRAFAGRRSGIRHSLKSLAFAQTFLNIARLASRIEWPPLIRARLSGRSGTMKAADRPVFE
ncbi:hypothetical protein T281_09495 [Rhodomicrobium udaipurense JA643]|nr:hypothetical protein T281_09495 [Rhodomicrobium udaipurense JA643]